MKGPRASCRGIVALVISCAAAVRLAAYKGMVGSDDLWYSELAHRVATGTFAVGGERGVPVFALRVGVFVPAAIVTRLVGFHEWAFVAYPFAMSLAFVGVAFAGGCMFFGRRAGAAAAAIAAVLPLDVAFATRLYADAPAALWAGCGVLLLKVAATRRAFRLGVAAGLAFSLSWLTKESVAFLFVVLVPWAVLTMVRDRRSLRAFAGAAITCIVVVISEAYIYALATGDALFRLHETERNYAVTSMWFLPAARASGAPALLRRAFIEGPAFFLLKPHFAFVIAVASLAAIYATAKRRGDWAFVAWWFVGLLFMFNFGSISLAGYRPLRLVPHYAFPLLLPAVLLAGAFLVTLWSTAASRVVNGRALAGSLALVVGGTASIACVGILRAGRGSPAEREIARRCAPDAVVYTDARSAAVLRHLGGYRAEFATHDFERLAPAAIPSLAYVFVNAERVSFLTTEYGYCEPTFASEPPAGWVPIWSDGKGARLYRVPSLPRAVSEAGATPRCPYPRTPVMFAPT